MEGSNVKVCRVRLAAVTNGYKVTWDEVIYGHPANPYDHPYVVSDKMKEAVFLVGKEKDALKLFREKAIAAGELDK